ncbi:type IV pilus assembly protein PilM [Dissulfurispira sp.]|uniref:type IV pilus assembly protein PilM n=1 Tax=Dissulfurispira sp. TaxID=2817609 RepID=UPI002FDA86C9
MFKKKNPIGLDIGSAYIKAVQINDTKTGYELALFDMIPIQPGVIGDRMIADKAKLTTSIKELLKKAGIKRNDAVISVSGHSSVIIKKITIPIMTEEELGASIKYEAEQYVPFDINDVEIDFQILGPKAEEEGQMDVVLVAVKKALIKDYHDVVAQAGLEPVIVDVDSFALSNMYEINYGIEERKNIALINVGASTTNINILQNGLPVFTRDSAMGSNHHTEALEREFGISREDAERLKMGRSVEGILPADVQLVINSASEEIYTELYRSFEYFRSSVAEEDIDKIILSGGAALIKGFPEAMTDRLGIEVEVADPFKNIKIPEKLDATHIKETAPIAAIAVGLALRRVGDR